MNEKINDHDYAVQFYTATPVFDSKPDGKQIQDITVSLEKKLKSNRICCVPKSEDDPVQAVWLNKIRRDEDRHFKISHNTVVCFLHFERDCLDESGFAKRRYLKPGAIPTLFDCWKDKPHLLKRISSGTCN
ncbi:hypothetical protein DPMN_116116 [Dreissena polymorpha]|uniref:THAP-type domain-containing protein n=1 Tax=Dreissena polymorpha TaxID=45954 RepID=A0A9D4KMH1_DREPO|nr:hypothetical protein DPMN_116116 [Dreissena polymorpha]